MVKTHWSKLHPDRQKGSILSYTQVLGQQRPLLISTVYSTRAGLGFDALWKVWMTHGECHSSYTVICSSWARGPRLWWVLKCLYQLLALFPVTFLLRVVICMHTVTPQVKLIFRIHLRFRSHLASFCQEKCKTFIISPDFPYPA